MKTTVNMLNIKARKIVQRVQNRINKTGAYENAGLYRDYVNNFLTVERFADYYNLTIPKALQIIKVGRITHGKEL